LASRPAAQNLVAPLLGLWPELGVVLTGSVEGPAVSGLLADSGRSARYRLETAERLGRLLAAFHAVPGRPARLSSVAGQLEELQQLARCLAAADARLGLRFEALLLALQTAAPAEVEHPVLTHGGFRAGQVVQRPSGDLTLLDLDGVGLGDPARDLATALAQLTWQGVRRPAQAVVLRQVQAAVVSGYKGADSSLDFNRLRWWRAAALLQLAGRRYRRLEVAQWVRVPEVLDEVESLLSGRHRQRGAAVTDELLDRQRAREFLAPVLAPVAAVPAEIDVVTARPLAEATGRRRVVQYTVTGLDVDGPVNLVAKVFEDRSRAELLYRHLTALSSGPFADGRWSVPAPLAYLPHLALVLYRAASGVPLSAVQTQSAALDGVRDAAGWLARLHLSRTCLPRAFDTGQEIRTAQQWAEAVAIHDPSLREAAHRLAVRWPTAARPRIDTFVPIHKDFHPGHVLIDRRVCVLDLDEARLGEAAYDLAHFCVYLEWSGEQAERLRTAFLQEYVRVTGWSDDGAFARYSAYTWLKIAKQLAVGSGPWREAGADQGWTPAAAVERGAACLGR